MKPIVIVGGGLSGLAAAVDLSSRNLPVLLLEQKRSPGGRTFSIREPLTGETIDNGQHLLIAGYRRTLKFLETVGSRDRLAVQPRPEIVFHHPEKGFRTLRLPRIPSPLHVAAGVLSCSLFSPRDRLAILKAGISLPAQGRRRHDLASMTVSGWLEAAGQSFEARRSFWEPLAVAIMNETCDVASAEVFQSALREAFLGHWSNASLAVPKVGLSELLVDPAVECIGRRGGEVRCSADVVRIVARDQRITRVQMKDGSDVEPEAVILAVPSLKVAPLLPEALRGDGRFQDIASAPMSPILSLYLWYDRDWMSHEHVGVIGKTVHWIFNRRKLSEQRGEYGGHLSLVISAARDLVNFSDDELIRLAVDDLVALYGPEAGKLQHGVVLREKRATLSLTPRVNRQRPGHITPVRNLFVAGDWTATGYPATIEGAVASGERCASLAVSFVRSGDAVVRNG
ncbi:MAG: hydroxysqualene dehydroxylase HpnE [Bacteroidetes bacterium]|nr:hydroxysqualene dehydroxylase HpnE [Bacteroidota bacterium]